MSAFDGRDRDWETPDRHERGRARDADLEILEATEIERDGRAYPLFLLLARRS